MFDLIAWLIFCKLIYFKIIFTRIVMSASSKNLFIDKNGKRNKIILNHLDTYLSIISILLIKRNKRASVIVEIPLFLPIPKDESMESF